MTTFSYLKLNFLTYHKFKREQRITISPVHMFPFDCERRLFSYSADLVLGFLVNVHTQELQNTVHIKTNLYAFCSSTLPRLFLSFTFLFHDYSFLQLLGKENKCTITIKFFILYFYFLEDQLNYLLSSNFAEFYCFKIRLLHFVHLN
ncbi:hypothetical protein BpHYR1_008416 [Brachionus plicatilis]|uniref:Uncharacterized protein n=1 Tax=Brachionus plicatilis TaxID=10195 RepID=A0A3M7SB49_BRAPC|nr:hypothetical protein BpHYR1_008416 [Brachionus plicatilis]